MRDYLVSLDPVTLIIMVVLLVIFLPVLLWLGITVLWIAAGLFAGTFVYFFLLYLFHIPLLAITGGVGIAILIWGALLRR